MAQPRVVLLACGSFNPPTPMHLRMFEIAKDYFHSLNTCSVIGGIVSPVHDSYGKKDLISASHRCAMLKLGLQSSNWIKVSEWEVKQEGWTKTRYSLQYHQSSVRKTFSFNNMNYPIAVDLNRRASKIGKSREEFSGASKNFINAYAQSSLNGNVEGDSPSWLPDDLIKYSTSDNMGVDETDSMIMNYRVNNGNEGEGGYMRNQIQVKLLCGADLLESFATPGLWAPEDLETILGEHGIVVITRSGSNPEKFIYDSDILTKYRRNITIITNWVPNEVSSTMIRRLVRRGESVKYLIDDSIISYIKRHKLYGSGDQNIKYLTTFNALQPCITTPSPNDIIMKSPSEFRMQKEEIVLKPRTNISTKIMNYLIGVDEIDSNDVYLPNNKSTGSQKRSRLTNKVSALNDLPPKAFCGDGNNQGSTDSLECMHILPRKCVKVITDVSGVHKIVNSKKKVCETNLDITDDVFVYINTKALIAEIERFHNSHAKTENHLFVDIGKLNINNDTPTESVDSPRSPLRSYDEIVKFIFSEHGIQVISDRETVV